VTFHPTNPSGTSTAAFYAPTGLTGATSASRYVGATTSGSPASGTFALGDYVIDQTGAIWVCTVAGTSGTWVKLGQLDATATDITAPGTQAAGAVGQAADAGHVHPYPLWLPGDDGFLVASFDPAAASGTANLTAGTVYLLRLNIRKAITATNICIGLSAAGNNTGGSAGTFVGLYSSGGTLLSGSSDVATSLVTTGLKSLALTTPQSLTAGTYVWATILVNLGTTQPQLGQANLATTSWGSLGQSASNFRWAVNNTSQTTLPNSITPGSNVQTNTHALWVAIT
jgi:hypothetical protein